MSSVHNSFESDSSSLIDIFHDLNRVSTVRCKEEAARRCNLDQCFFCDVQFQSITSLYYVVPPTDSVVSLQMTKRKRHWHWQFEDLQQAGDLTLSSFKDYRNTIVLCCNCNSAYNKRWNVSWVFLSTNLEFFIQWEDDDFAKRLNLFRTNCRMVPRTFPDEHDWEDYSRKKEYAMLPDDSRCLGGFYNRYLLRNIFPPSSWSHITEKYRDQCLPTVYPPTPKRRYGSPMIAIYRAIKLMGTLRPILPNTEW